jgi:hypothetical protein
MKANHVFATALLSIVVAAACGGLGGGNFVDDTIEDFVYKLDDCNYLEGASIDEAIAYFEGCVHDLPEGYQEDWANQIQDCVSLNACGLFADCYWTVPWC